MPRLQQHSYLQQQQRQSPSQLLAQLLQLPQLPPGSSSADSSSVRRSSDLRGSEKYVTFFRGRPGGRTWGYSYRLKK